MFRSDAVLRRFVRFTLTVAAASAASAAAWAQNAPAQESSDQSAPEEIVVTGSRIPAPNLESTSPIQVVTSQDIALGGRMDVSDIINQLPQNFSNSLGQDLGNRTSGLATPGGVSTADKARRPVSAGGKRRATALYLLSSHGPLSFV